MVAVAVVMGEAEAVMAVAPVAHAVGAVVAVTGAAVAGVVAEAGIAEHQAELRCLSAHIPKPLGSPLRLNYKALFILNTHPKIQKLRIPHGYRTHSLHHQT